MILKNCILERNVFKMLALVSVLFLINDCGAHVRVAKNHNGDCILKEKHFWDVHSWYFEHAQSVTVKVLLSTQYTAMLTYYVDELLKFIHAQKGFQKTITIIKFFMGSRAKRKVEVNKEEDEFIPVTSVGLYNTTHYDKDKIRRARRYSGHPHDAHIIIVWDESILKRFLAKKSATIINNPRATYLLMLIENSPSGCINTNNDFYKILPSLWFDFNVLNVIALAPCSCDPRSLFTYDPFYYNDTMKSWGTVRKTMLFEAVEAPNKIVNTLTSFRGYPLNVSMFGRIPTAIKDLPESMRRYSCSYVNLSHGFEGFDGCVLGYMAHYLNFQVAMFAPGDNYDFGTRLKNGTYVGSLGDVSYRRADISTNARFINYRSDNIEYTRYIAYDVVCFVVPKAKRIPQWIMIFNCFKLSTWCVLLLISPLVATFYNLIKRLGLEVVSDLTLSKDILDISGLIIGLGMPKVPVFSHLRLILVTCMIFSVIFVCIFQGSLFKSFTKISYYPDIHTMQELYDSHMPISTSLDIFHNASDILKKLKRRSIKLEEKAITRAALKRDVVACERKRDANLLIQTLYISKSGLPLLYVVPECPTPFYLAYIVPKYSPFLPRFNVILSRFLEAGLLDKWYNNIVDGFIMQTKIKTLRDVDILKPFKFEDVQTPFYILGIGLTISVFIFLAELSYANVVKKRQQKKVNKF